MGELQRASVFAIKEETTTGTLIAPTAGSDFIPLKQGFEISSAVEELDNEELTNDIGKAKALIGKENPTGTHGIYFKNSETIAVEPEWFLLLESALGGKTAAGTERDTVAGSTAGTSAARAVVNVDTGEGVEFEEGKALMIKDSTNGYSIRNVFSISSDALSLNFNLDNAPASGVNLGRPTLLKPAATGHPSFSAWMYTANGAAIQAAAGCKTDSVTINLPAAGQASCDFTYAGTAFYWNPIEITSANKYIDLTDSVGTVVVTLTEKFYKSPIELADEIASKATAASAASAADTISCTYQSLGANAGKFIISSDGSVLSLLWKTGTHGSDFADDHVGTTIGFSDAADDTGSLSYTGDSSISLAAPFTPSYDNATNIVVKKAELMIGDFSDNVCRQANNVVVNIGTPQTDVDDICSDTGLAERLTLERTVTITSTLILQQYESSLFDKFINNGEVEVMVNVGPKDGAGNWVEGKCLNIYMQAGTITSHITGGDEIVTKEIVATGFVSSDKKDLYINAI